MISVFGDESSSSAPATYRLLVIEDRNLAALDGIVAAAFRSLRATKPEPLHGKILFHEDRRKKSAFRNATRYEVETVCATLLKQIAFLNVVFYLDRVERNRSPKILHVPLVS